MQCAILCGGLGTRLGALTADTPKPLLLVGGKPFIETLLFELGRQGIRSVLLLAGFHSDKIAAFAASSPAVRRFGMTVTVSVEPRPAGTGGALWYARTHLAEPFFLMNGDTWFDVSLLSLWSDYQSAASKIQGVVALRFVDDAGRYGAVETKGRLVTGFHEKTAGGRSGHINGGVYLLSRQVLERAAPDSSLERDILPALAVGDQLAGRAFDESYFIDIGIPETYQRAQTEIPAQKTRPAAFLDRDGVINIDHGYVGSVDRFQFIEGAPGAIRSLNDAGYYVFVVSNQAGIGRGFYTESDHLTVMHHMAEELRAHGAHIDDHRFSPYHPEAADPAYRLDHPWRKPRPGMLLDLMDHWPIDAAQSLVVGDKDSDVEAAAAAGLPGFLFEGGDLSAFVSDLLKHARNAGRG